MAFNLKSRISTVKKATLQPLYFFLFAVILALYLGFNFYINQFNEVLPVFLKFRLLFVIPYAALSILIGLLVAININLVIYKVRELRTVTAASSKKESGLTAIGIFGGLLGGACPGCFVGLLPTLSAAIGLNIALGSLPFKGFEIQISTLLILLLTTYILTNPLTCKVKLPS